MKKDSNILQTPTTNTYERKTKPPSGLLLRCDDGVVYPTLALAVYVSGPDIDTEGFASWLGRAGCQRAEYPAKADLVVFSGGPDVDPSLYGDRTLDCTHVDKFRDVEDEQLYDLCKRERIPMLGICRGSQYLWTKLGGSLYQDVDGHNSGEHEILYLPTKTKYLASSVHHQMVVPKSIEGLRLLATSNESQSRKGDSRESVGRSSDFEIWAHGPSAILGIQGHPEYPGFPQYSKLCADLIQEHIYDNPNTEYKNGFLRVTEKEIK
jgi:GMP synthase-like glutamine amidotransferase